MARTVPRLYVDESGHTGAHWLDPAQPTFVHGGWLFTPEAELSVTEGVDEIRRRHRLKAPELKWTQFARRGRLPVFREIFELCYQQGVLPFFVVMDKRYITAAKIVETFFDPAYNHHFPIGFTGDFETKKRLAEAVLLSSDLLVEFAPLLRTGDRPSAESVKAIAVTLAAHLESVGVPSFARTLTDLSETGIDEICQEFTAERWLRTTIGHSTWNLMSKASGFVSARGIEVEIIHDQVARFDEIFTAVEGLPGVNRLEIVDSRHHLGVQLADLLCGVTAQIFTSIAERTALGDDERWVLANLFMVKYEFETWDGNLPEETWATLARESWAELRRQFGPRSDTA